MVDFVRLQAVAAQFLESQLPDSNVATAWPYTGALSRPEYGYVERPMIAVETNNFHFSSVASIPPGEVQHIGGLYAYLGPAQRSNRTAVDPQIPEPVL